MNGINEIKKDIQQQELDSKNRYELTEGTHILLINLNSKEKCIFDWNEGNKKLYYHKFNLINYENKYVLFSNYLYGEFLVKLKPYLYKLNGNMTTIETIIEVIKEENKTKYNIKIKGDTE